MRAYVLPGPGQPPRLADLAEPRPAGGEVLVRVDATSVNPVDALVAAGFFEPIQEYRYPAVFGRDLCGVVVELGDGVTGLAVGDEVFGFIKRDHIGDGTFAEFVTCPADHFIAAKPAGLDVAEAGAAGLSGITAQECLDVVDLQPGQTVLINGATGGVGSFTIQLAALRGLDVIATARPGPATDFVSELGANTVVDRTGDVVGQLTGREIAGLVDLVRRDTSTRMGADETVPQQHFGQFARQVVRPGGRVVSLTNSAQPQFLGGLAGFNVHSTPSADAVRRLGAAMAHGVRTPIDATYAFDDIDRAFARHAAGGVLGKVSIRIR